MLFSVSKQCVAMVAFSRVIRTTRMSSDESASDLDETPLSRLKVPPQPPAVRPGTAASNSSIVSSLSSVPSNGTVSKCDLLIFS